MKLTEKNKVLKIAGIALGIAISIGIGIAIGRSIKELEPEVAELIDRINELEVENERLSKENHKLYKRIEALIYHLGQVVESVRNKSYRL